MNTLPTQPSFPVWTDIDGEPLQAGYLYFGAINQNPETTPISVYWDAAGTIPAPQPIRTINGYASRNGTPANVFIPTDYSLTVRDRNGVLVYTTATSNSGIFALLVLLLTSIGSSLIGFIQGGVGAVLRTVQDKLRERISVKDFGATGDGVTDDTAAINAAVTYANTLGGGTVLFPPGTYATATGITLGNGTNAAPSSIHNKIKLIGEGYGSSSAVINQQIDGTSRILYTGAIAAATAVLTLAGPMYGVKIEDLALDSASKAGRGIIINHVTESTFHRVSTRNMRAIGWEFTTRTGFPAGCAFGCADNRITDCYSWVDDVALAALDIMGIVLTSGLSPAVSLVGNPDSARNVFIGGTFMYGTTAASYGVYLNGADNNSMYEVQLFPYGGVSAGKDVWFQQWAASGNFPLENFFCNLGMLIGIGGNGGVGSSYGNTFFPFCDSDGATGMVGTSGVSGGNHAGVSYVQGLRAYRGRQVQEASSTTIRSTSNAAFVDVTDYAVTLNDCIANSIFVIDYAINALQNAAGTGFFIIKVDGLTYLQSQGSIGATGYDGVVSGKLVLTGLAAGSHTFKVQCHSNGVNNTDALNGTLNVEERW